MKKSAWSEFIKPVVVLVSICIVTSALLAVTNGVTEPIIIESERLAAEAQRTALLPADSFEQVETEAEGVTEIYKAGDGTGYVVTAEANGYNGAVPVMVAFDANATIIGVSFLPNGETPGFGQKVREEEFQIQFSGIPAETMTLSDIDAVTGATVSSSAAVEALNRAITAYGEASGNASGAVNMADMTRDEVHEMILPNSGGAVPIDVADPNIIEALKGESYGLIVYAEEEGYHGEPITAAVGFDDAGVITGVWFDASGETAGLGDGVATNPDFAQGFIGDSETADTDIIAHATVSSTAAIDAVNKAVQFAQTQLGG